MEGVLHLNRVDSEGVGSNGDRKKTLDASIRPLPPVAQHG
jgi:hypothetical protein